MGPSWTFTDLMLLPDGYAGLRDVIWILVKMIERVPHSCPQHGIADRKNIPSMCAKLLPQQKRMYRRQGG